MVLYAFGDTYSLSESLVKATPILLCAFAVIMPARLGLITVGGEGQLYFGALTGTAIVVSFPMGRSFSLLPAMLCGRRARRCDMERDSWAAARPL